MSDTATMNADQLATLKAKGGSCAEYEVERSYIVEVCLGTQIPLKLADACIAELMDDVETSRALVTSAHRAENAKQRVLDEMRHRAEKAEAELAEADRRQAEHLDTIKRLEAEVERLRWMLDGAAGDAANEVDTSPAAYLADLAARYEKEQS